ncbi:MAG: hypothetical protein WA888_06535 [Burkholderiaceae bacterium]
MDKIPSFSYQRFDSRSGAQSALDIALESARRSVKIFDRDGEFYGLDRPTISDCLNRLLKTSPDTTVSIIVQRTHFIQRDCTRLVNVLKIHAPRFQILRLDPRLASFERGYIIIDSSVVIRRPHFDQRVTYWDVDEQQIAGASRLFSDLRVNTVPAIAASVTGL